MKNLIYIAVFLYYLNYVLTSAFAQGNTYTSSFTGGILKIGELEPPDALDPYTSVQNMPNIHLMEFLFEALLEEDVNGNLVVPKLAEEMPLVQGNKVTVKLRENVVWHDSTNFTSSDVRFTYALLKNSAMSTDPYFKKLAEKVVECRTIGAYQVEFILKPGVENPLEIFTLDILPEHVIKEEILRKNHVFVRKPVGTGPYKLQKRRENTIVLIVQDPHYNGRANIDKIIMEYIPDPQILLTLLKSPSGLDAVVDVPHQDIAEIISTRQFNVENYDSRSFNYIGYNFNNPLLKVKQIRYAINLAIDRAEILEVHYRGLGALISGPFSPACKYNNPNIDPDLPPFRPQVALDLLKKIGCTDRDGNGVLEYNGQPLQFTMIVRVEDNDTPAALAIQDYLKQIGIKIYIKHMRTETIKREVFQNKKFDMLLAGWVFDEGCNITSLFHSKGHNNFISFTNEKIDKYIEAIGRVKDPEKKRLLNYKLHELIFKELPYTFLWSLEKYIAIHKRVHGVKALHPFKLFPYIKQWYIPLDYQF